MWLYENGSQESEFRSQNGSRYAAEMGADMPQTGLSARVKFEGVHRDHRGERGITLIEMLVVVTIIALFAALVGPAMLKQGDKARVTQAHAQIDSFLTALG